MDLLKRIAELLSRILENLRGSRDLHLEDRVGSEVWGKFGSATLAPGASADIITVTNPRSFGMATHDLGIEATPALWGTGTGITYALKRQEDAGWPHLSALDFPWGTIAARMRLKLSIRTGEKFILTVTNSSATETIDVCAAATGMYYSAVRGIVSDEVA